MTERHIKTAREAIDLLGGTKGVMALTGRRRSSVSNWRKTGRFSSRFSDVISAALRMKGCVADPSILNQETPHFPDTSDRPFGAPGP